MEIKSGWGGLREGAGRPRKERIIQSRPSGRRWYVLSIAAGQETATVRDLATGETRPGYPFRPEYEAYLPQTNVLRIVRGKRALIVVPMLAGYAFVRFDARVDDWHPIASCPGVKRLFTTKTMVPIPVADSDIMGLRDLSERKLGMDPLKMPVRERGAMLRVADGPFTSFPALVIKCDGITTTAAVTVFGRNVPVTLPWAAFEKA